WARGTELLFASENRLAITWFRNALEYDPDYAGAWMGLGFSFGNLEEPDSALAAFREAHARPGRLSDLARLSCEIMLSALGGDVATALALSERQVQLYPQRWTVHNNRSAYLLSVGRFSEALECARTAEQVSPFGASQQVLLNQFDTLLWGLGRLDE